MCGYSVSPWDLLGPCTRVKDHVDCSLVHRKGRAGNGACYDQELHLGGPVESLLAGAGL